MCEDNKWDEQNIYISLYIDIYIYIYIITNR